MYTVLSSFGIPSERREIKVNNFLSKGGKKYITLLNFSLLTNRFKTFYLAARTFRNVENFGTDSKICNFINFVHDNEVGPRLTIHLQEKVLHPTYST